MTKLFLFFFFFPMLIFIITSIWYDHISFLCCEFESYSGKMYLIQHYVIKFVRDLWQFDGYLRVLWFPPTIKLTAMISLKYCSKWPSKRTHFQVPLSALVPIIYRFVIYNITTLSFISYPRSPFLAAICIGENPFLFSKSRSIPGQSKMTSNISMLSLCCLTMASTTALSPSASCVVN